MEKFDPNKKMYKKINDLPIQERENFKPVEGGFIRQEVVENLEDLQIIDEREECASEYTPNRSGHLHKEYIKPISFSGKIKGIDISVTYRSQSTVRGLRGHEGYLNGKKINPEDAKKLYEKYYPSLADTYNEISKHQINEENTKRGIQLDAQQKKYENNITPLVDMLL